MGTQNCSFHPVIWSHRLTVIFSYPSNVNLIVPLKRTKNIQTLSLHSPLPLGNQSPDKQKSSLVKLPPSKLN